MKAKITEREALVAVGTLMTGLVGLLGPCPLRDDLQGLADAYLAAAVDEPAPSQPENRGLRLVL